MNFVEFCITTKVFSFLLGEKCLILSQKPQNISINLVNEKSIYVNVHQFPWPEICKTVSKPATLHQFTLCKSGGVSCLEKTSINHSITIENLIPSTEYELRVSWTNHFTDNSYRLISDLQRFTTKSDVYNDKWFLKIFSLTPNSITVFWSQPADQISNYVISFTTVSEKM